MKLPTNPFPPLDTSDLAKTLRTDLRSVSRESDRCSTRVIIDFGWDPQKVDMSLKFEWLILGQAGMRRQRERDAARMLLTAYLDNATDFEHDSAYCLQLPLIGLALDDLPMHYHMIRFKGWVDPNCGPELGFTGDFHVPRPGYDPRKHPKAKICREERCHDEDENGKKVTSHVIVPEGFYVPPFDRELYELVKGKPVEIQIGPTRKDM